MSSIDPAVVRAVLELADPVVVPALGARLGADPTVWAAALRETRTAPAAPGDAVPLAEPAREGPHAPEPADPAPRETHPDHDDPVRRAGRPDPTPAEVDALLDLDDPLVDAALFAGHRLADRERARLLAGERRDGSRGRVPDALISVLWDTTLDRCTRWLAAGSAAGDPGVARVAVNRRTPRTEAGRLRVPTAVWERYGRAEAHAVWSEAGYPADTRAVVEAAFADPNGLALLRGHLAVEADPERLVAALCDADEANAARVEAILADGGPLPWAHLIRAHRARTLPAVVARGLAEQPGCPRELLLALLADGVTDADGDAAWLDAALVRGDLTGADVLHHARPAAAALALLAGTDVRTAPDRWAHGSPRAEAQSLVDATLGTVGEAWIVAVRLFPDFTGTIPELLATTSAIIDAPTRG